MNAFNDGETYVFNQTLHISLNKTLPDKHVPLPTGVVGIFLVGGRWISRHKKTESHVNAHAHIL